jgi:Cu2+-exporting ATPase
MCCKGCEAVAQAIVDNGLDEFYRHRTENAPTGQELVPEFLRQARAYDHPQVQKTFVHVESDSVREASLILEGITCAACVWLNERQISALPGVLEVNVNYATHRARVKWDNTRIQLSQILEAVHNIGYVAHPYDPSHQERLIENERRALLKRLGVAAVLGMQVMILAVSMYAGDYYGMEVEFRSFFSWISLGITLPILIFRSAVLPRGVARPDALANRHGCTGIAGHQHRLCRLCLGNLASIRPRLLRLGGNVRVLFADRALLRAGGT